MKSLHWLHIHLGLQLGYLREMEMFPIELKKYIYDSFSCLSNAVFLYQMPCSNFRSNTLLHPPEDFSFSPFTSDIPALKSL